MDPSPAISRQRLYSAIFHGVWIVLAFVALWQRLSLPLEPQADPDTWGFLNPELQSLLGHGFQHTQGRNFLYPSFIGALLDIFKDFRAITVAHRLLGVGTGVLLLGSWVQVRRCFSNPRIPQWVFDLAGLLTMAIYLFAPEPQQFEYFIRPDVVCPFFASLALYSVVRFLGGKNAKPDSRRPLVFGALAIFLALVIPALKPSYWLTSVIVTIPIWFGVFDRRETLVRRLLLVAIPSAAAILLVWMPERHFAATDLWSKTWLPQSLFSIHAVIIREQMAEDVAHPDPVVPYSHEKLASTLALLDRGIAEAKEKSPRHFDSLGYDPDYLLYHQSFFRDVAEAESRNWDVIVRFYKFYYLRAWRKRPGPMLHKVATQLGLFYNFDSCPAYCDKKFHLQGTYDCSLSALSDRSLQKTLKQWPPAVRWLDHQAALAKSEAVDWRNKPCTNKTLLRMNKMLRFVIDWLGCSYLPAHLAFLLALPWVIFHKRRRADFGLAAAALAVGYAFNLGNNLGIAIMHTLQEPRYNHIQFCTTLWTEMLTIVFLIELALDVILARRGKFEAPARNEHSDPPLVLEKSAVDL
jgi:hypothetical protein